MKELAPGTTIGNYVVERWLDRGGVASVYLGRHVRLGAAYVLKLVHRPVPAILPRLLLEGQLQSRLAHPNVLSVFDLLEWRGNPVLVLEYVDGPNLDELLRLRRLELDQVDELATGILRGVSAAHRFGLVHRDLKPSNILLARYDHALVPKIADFGLAKVLDTDPGEVRTRTGQVFGTPSYMSPEQFVSAASVDVRTDIFALGCILYEMVGGERAYGGTDLFAVNRRILEGDRKPLSLLRPDVPQRMARAIDRCLQVRRSDRFDSCEELLAAWRSSAPEDAPAWLRPASAVARLTISHEELDSLRERRRTTASDASRSSPTPLGGDDAHLSPERLVATPLPEEDAKHLAGCARCRVHRLQLQRAEEDAAPAPVPAPEPPALAATVLAAPEVLGAPTVLSAPAQLPPPVEVDAAPSLPPEEEATEAAGRSRGWLAMAVLVPMAAGIGFFSVLGALIALWVVGHRAPPEARVAAAAPEPPPAAPLPLPTPEPAPVVVAEAEPPASAAVAPPLPVAPRVAPRAPAPPPPPPVEELTPPPPEPPRPTTATWSALGDAHTVWLMNPKGLRFLQGDEVPPGKYQWIASFGRHGEVRGDWVRVAAGDHLVLRCAEAFAACKVE